MLQEFSLENPLFSLEPSSIIAIGHSTHLLREYALDFLHHFPFIPLYEELSIRELKIPPKEEEGTHKSSFLSTVFFLLIY
jgi:hypothetical protein